MHMSTTTQIAGRMASLVFPCFLIDQVFLECTLRESKTEKGITSNNYREKILDTEIDPTICPLKDRDRTFEEFRLGKNQHFNLCARRVVTPSSFYSHGSIDRENFSEDFRDIQRLHQMRCFVNLVVTYVCEFHGNARHRRLSHRSTEADVDIRYRCWIL